MQICITLGIDPLRFVGSSRDDEAAKRRIIDSALAVFGGSGSPGFRAGRDGRDAQCAAEVRRSTRSGAAPTTPRMRSCSNRTDRTRPTQRCNRLTTTVVFDHEFEGKSRKCLYRANVDRITVIVDGTKSIAYRWDETGAAGEYRGARASRGSRVQIAPEVKALPRRGLPCGRSRENSDVPRPCVASDDNAEFDSARCLRSRPECSDALISVRL
jgi:hypothetical protein